MSAKVIIVGAGPGDPDLITVKGLKAIQSADVLLYDALVHHELIAQATKAEKVFVGKRKGKEYTSQDKINELLVEKAHSNKIVVRLKGGDPFVFGRGFEEMKFVLNHGISVETIPGLSSSISVPGLSNIPVSLRDVNKGFQVVTAIDKGKKLTDEVKNAIHYPGTTIVLMGYTKLKQISSIFIENGKSDMPVAVIHNGSWEDSMICSGQMNNIFEKCEAMQMKCPALIVIGDVVEKAEELNSMIENCKVLDYENQNVA